MTREEAALRKCEDNLERLLSSHNNQLAMFGHSMRQLVDAIDRNHTHFSHRPRGPLGSMVKLHDYSWSTAVEQVIKRSLLYAFVADNHKDADQLRRMIRDVYARQQGPRPDVIVSRFQTNVYDVRRHVSISPSP